MNNKKLIIINGPNLNLLGEREPEVYGTETLIDLEKMVQNHIKKSNLNIDTVFFQSNRRRTGKFNSRSWKNIKWNYN